MNTSELRENLINQGIPTLMVDAMIKQAQKTTERELRASQPKAKKAGKWYPGMADGGSKKVEADVEVTAICCTCGDVLLKTVKMVIKADSPRTQRVNVSVCSHCPEYFRALDHELLVTLCILRENPAVVSEHASPMKLALHLTPEEAVTFTTIK